MRRRVTVIVVLLGTLTGSCRRQPVEPPAPAAPTLSGQVFTIRSDGLNLPLGDVTVSWVSARRLEREIGWIGERVGRVEALLAYEATLDDLQASLERIRGDRRPGDLLGRFVTQAGGLLGQCRLAFEQNEEIELLLGSPRFAAAQPALFEGSGFDRDPQSHWMLVHLFLARIEAIRSASTATDAEGRFLLGIPEGQDGYLLAHARTSALGSSHHDYWIHPVAEEPRGDLVFSPRSRLGPQAFRKLLEPWMGDAGTPDLAALYDLPDLEPLAAALESYDAIERNLDERDHLRQRIEALRAELSDWVPPPGN